MNRLIIVLVVILVIPFVGKAQTLTESNLPIIVIDTGGEEITDDGKAAGTMQVYYNEDGGMNSINDEPTDYNSTIEIKLRGQTSLFLFDKKSYNLETVDAEGKDSTVNLLGMPKESDWVLHGPFSDKSLMRNALLYTMADDILSYSPRVQMAEIIVNEDYKGVYLFTEKIKRDDSRVDIANVKKSDIEGIEVTGGYILKFDKAENEEIGWASPYSKSSTQPTNFVYDEPDWEDIQPEQEEYIENWITEFEDVLASDDFADPDIGYAKYINVETFIDHLLLNELSRNVDAYRISTYMYKTKDQEDDPGQLYMGPVWDYNLAFGNADYCEGSTIEGWAYDFNEVCEDDFYQVHFWWKRLMEDPVFEEELREKWQKLRNGKFSNANVNAWIDGFAAELAGPQVRNFERWPVLGVYVWPNNFVGDTWQEEVDYLRGWLMDRMNWMDETFDIELSVESDFSADQLIITPNPALDNLTLKGEFVSDNMIFEILGLDGKIFMKGALNKGKEIQIQQLPRGTFVLVLNDDKRSYSQKFVKL
ncbi:MAG: CotH kinase family protein [Bacteroidota bacterium]